MIHNLKIERLTIEQWKVKFEQKVREYFKFDFCDKQYQERKQFLEELK